MSNYNFKVYDILTPVFRVSYPKLDAPSKLSGKFELDALFEPNADFSAMVKAVQDVFANNGLAGNTPYTWFKDGNTKLDKGTSNITTGYAGKTYMTFRAQNAIGTAKQLPTGDVVDCPANELYGGCYAIASVTCYVYDTPTVGVSFAVNHVLKVGEGESFGGGVHDAASAFRGATAIQLPPGAAPVSAVAAPAGMPAPQMAAPVAPAPAPQVVMTALAGQYTLADMMAAGWTVDALVAQGYATMAAPMAPAPAPMAPAPAPMAPAPAPMAPAPQMAPAPAPTAYVQQVMAPPMPR